MRISVLNLAAQVTSNVISYLIRNLLASVIYLWVSCTGLSTKLRKISPGSCHPPQKENVIQPNSVYDKAKYHFETVEQRGLPEEHAMNHTVFFLRWLIENRLVSDFFEEETAEVLLQFRQSQCSIHQIYEWWDCCLAPEMLSDEGNAFAMQYFDFEKGQYLNDYVTTLQQKLPTEFHIVYNEANYQQLKVVMDSRYKDWSSTPPAAQNKASLTVIANWLLLTGLASFVFAGLNFGTIGAAWLVLIIYFCTLYSLIAVPLSLVLYLIAAIMRWRKK